MATSANSNGDAARSDSRRTLSRNVSHLYLFEFSKHSVCVPLWTLPLHRT